MSKVYVYQERLYGELSFAYDQYKYYNTATLTATNNVLRKVESMRYDHSLAYYKSFLAHTIRSLHKCGLEPTGIPKEVIAELVLDGLL